MSGQETEYSDEWVLRNLKNFIVDQIADPIYELMMDKEEGLFYGIPVNFLNLVQENMILGSMLISYPKRMLRLFDDAIWFFQKDVKEHHPLKAQMTLKPKVHVRISNLPLNAETTKGVLPKSSDIGNLLAVRGTVIRTGLAKMLEWKKEYQCTRCKFEWEQEADIESVNPFPIPTQCLNPITPPCNNHKFLVKEGVQVECKDYQEIKIQEQVHQLGVGAIPRSINVILMDDLVDFCKAGDDVTIAGIVSRRWRPMAEDERCDLEMILLANHIRVNNEQKASNINEDLRREFEEFWKKNRHAPLRARDMVISALCPELAGLHVAKTAVALALAGGVPRVDARGTTLRGEAHVLLVGDAGTGKSQLLRTASKVATRSVLTTGAGTTSAGLTVTAVKDKGGEWVLEAGALVLADGGICCIDEFGTIQEHDKAAIHEAMEQQTISVAKAGLVCKLRSRCSIISAMNPKGKFDTDESLSVNVAMATPLLSRFDLVILLLDEQNRDWDTNVCDFILRGHKTDVKPELVNKPLWPLDKLQVYFSYIKSAFAPDMTPESQEVLQMYYRKQRATDQRNAARTTLRLLESMIRLAQAHAKLMFRTQVTLQDAVCAVLIVESSMQTSAMLGVNSALRSYPSEDPDTLYIDQEVLVLQHLGLPHLIRDHTPIDIDNDDAPQPRDYDIRADQQVEDDGRELTGLTGQSAVSEDLFDSQYSKWDQLRKKGPNNNNNNTPGVMQIKEELPSDFSGSMIPPTYPPDTANNNHNVSTLLRKRKLEDTDPLNPDTRPVKRAKSPPSGDDENQNFNEENNNEAAVDDWAADVSLDWGIGDLNQPKNNNTDWDQQFV